MKTAPVLTSSKSTYLARQTVCLVALALVSIPVLKAEKIGSSPAMVRPPMPESTFLQTYIGSKKTILLRIGGRIEEPLKVIIRKHPRIGSLANPVPAGRNKIVIEYTAPASAKPGADSFTYAVQSIDSPVSAPARVDIQLLERPADLRMAKDLRFPTLDPGGMAEQVLTIENSGGATATLHPRVNAPWHLPDDSPVEIPGGATRSITLRFTPKTEGTFSDRLILNDDTRVTLHGQALDPLDWPGLGLQFDAASRDSGVVHLPISNRAGDSRFVSFEWPDFLSAPKEISLEAGEKKIVPVRLNADPTFSKKGSINISTGAFQSSIPFAVYPAPPEVVLSPDSAIEFGEVSNNLPLSASIALINRGGLPIRLRLALPKQINATPRATDFQLEPGMTSTIDLVWTPQETGSCEATIPVLAGSAAIGEFTLKASVKAAQAVEKLLTLPPPPVPIAKPEQPQMAAIPPVEECFLVESTTHSVTISWRLTSHVTKDFLVERRTIRSGADGRVIEEWVPWRQVEIQIAGDNATAHFLKLAPGTFWNIRLRGIDANGLTGPPTPGHFRIETRPLNLWKIPFWIWMPALAALAVSVFFFLKKHNRLAGDELERRIAQLEK